jgi:hypothetical protein
MSLVRALALTVFGFAVLLSGRATAMEAPLVTLDYDAGASLSGCPSLLDFRRIVTEQLGYDPFRDKQSQRVLVRVEAMESGLEGRVEWQDATGTREGEQTFSSRNQDCGRLTKTMGFAIVVQIQLLGAPGAPPVKSSPDPIKTPPSEASPSAAVVPARPTPDRSFCIGLGAFIGLGLAPAQTFEGRIFGALHLSHSSFELGAEGSWPSTFRNAGGSGFSEALLAATLAACGEGGRWSACALGKVGKLRVQGTGVDESRVSSGIFAQAGLRLAMSQSLGERLAAVAHLEGLKQLKPWTVTVNQVGVWTTPQFAATCGIDIVLRFP